MHGADVHNTCWGVCVAYNNLVSDVHDATGEDRSETVLHDSQGGLARKERVLLGSPLPMLKKRKDLHG